MQKNSFPIAIKYAAYAGLMFFSFLVEKKLKTDYQDFSQDERDFVNNRCQIGRICLGGLGIFVLLFAIGEGAAFGFFSRIAKIVLMMLIFVQIGGILLISRDLSLTSQTIPLQNQQKRQLLRLFLPGKTEKSWFQQTDFSKPNRRLKESQLWRAMICFAFLAFPRAEIGILIGLFLLLRLILLYQGQDWIPVNIKTALNLTYLKYVEEISFLPYLLIKQWKKGESRIDLSQLQALQMRSQTSNFFGSRRWIGVWGAFLLLVAIFGIWTEMRRKLIPLSWRISRRSFLKK